MYRIHAVVLRRRNLGESDRILTVFSRELGKHRFVSKGVRRPGSKQAGHSEPFMISEFLLARTRGLPIASQAEVRRSFRNLRLDERAIATASLIAERVDVFTAEDEAAVEVFDLLESSFDLLDQGTPPERVLLIFDVLMLGVAGFRPSLQTCIECGEPLAAVPNVFDFERGGLVCQSCAPRIPRGRVIPVEIQKLLRLIDRGEIGQILGVRTISELFHQADALIAEYISSVTGRDSMASRVIRELRLEYNYQDQSSEEEDHNELSG
ncbi:MAG: DNA repair protein RecO [Thermomicrobiales bacterium]